ncbi:hypothetical protein [Arthrobacter antibioticus]|uniref:hypothetical protein n=1 Tax=Arthrobacter sp. H35-MC1 TaxID=3046203 RepID=UPI0024BB56EC|nr:hypothetical protein [Arthrobacter sp. H35-MC1]MDJ0317841.1 hypothetical protein [Arthrobacter sp. H35-MC1]
MTEQHTPSKQAATSPENSAVSNAVVGPLTIRDLVVLGGVAIIFIASVVPIIVTIAGSLNIWNTSGLFFLGIGVILPLVVGGLFLARRLSPQTQVRVGSLSIDQFASVVAAFATFFFFTGTVTNFSFALLVGLVGSLILLAATVCAQWIPFLASDFAGRVEVPAHIAARDAVPAHKRPAAPKPVVANQNGGGAFGQGKPQGPGAQGQYVPGQTTQAPVGGQQNQPTGAWPAAQEHSGHTSAGQIFTPANSSTGPAQAGSAAADTSHAPAAAAAAAVAAEGVSWDGANIADTHGHASSSAAAPAQLSNQAPAPAHGSSDSSTAVRSDDGAATTLNPQVAVPAKESAPAKGDSALSRPSTTDPSTTDPGTTHGDASPAKESIAATVSPKTSAAAVIAEPFWFAVDRPQNVIDDKSRQFVFKLTPGSWILALEDRGTSFLVQNNHGKTGVLLDIVGIERASDSA